MDIEIYVNGKKDRGAMLKHKVARIATEYGRKIDYWFTHDGQWPAEVE